LNDAWKRGHRDVDLYKPLIEQHIAIIHIAADTNEGASGATSATAAYICTIVKEAASAPSGGLDVGSAIEGLAQGVNADSPCYTFCYCHFLVTAGNGTIGEYCFRGATNNFEFGVGPYYESSYGWAADDASTQAVGVLIVDD